MKIELGPAAKRALQLGLQLRMMFAPDLVIATNAKGEMFQVIVPVSHKVKRFRFTPKCADLCGHELHRPHFSCLMTYFGLGCRLRRVKVGKLPEVTPISLYFLLILENRNCLVAKRLLLKNSLSFNEAILAN